MINISHPRTQNKPPLKRHQPPQRAENVKPSQAAITQTGEDHNNNVEKVETGKLEISDYNQNNIDQPFCSIEQLCDMINDLEKNVSTELPEANSLQVGMKPDGGNLIFEDCAVQLQPERDNSNAKCGSNLTSYDDIMCFLGSLEEGNLTRTSNNVPEVDPSMLQILAGVPPPSYLNHNSPAKPESHAFKEDLVMARLQIEERNETIKLLKEQLKTERKTACEKLESQRKSDASKLHAQEQKYRNMIKRHQKFIEQLIAEKTELTEKCNSLAHRIKETETRVQRDLKVAADRHAVELQRAKEHYAASEKIRRERWLEARTLKIKEMTVKGLEPELKNMMEQHEEELQKIRNAHMKELQDAELRVIRRSNQQLEQLRLELMESHEKMLTDEKNILRSRYQEKLNDQEIQYKMECKKLTEDMQRERTMMLEEQARKDSERDAAVEQAKAKFQQEAESLRLQHATEKKAFEELLKTEWEGWISNYKRQQILKFEKMENKIREECSKERDKQIEVAIERLERNSREIHLTLEESFDSKLKSLKNKYEVDLQAALNSENTYKEKLRLVEDKFEKTQIQLEKTENKLKECVSDLNSTKELIGRITNEKDNAKKFARQEIEAEKRELEEKIASLYQEITRNNANRDASLAQLHSRIKLVVTQKMLTIRNLLKELDERKERCEHLEKLLDQQRKEYILKGL